MNIGPRVYGHRSPTISGTAATQAIQAHRVATAYTPLEDDAQRILPGLE